MMGGRLELGFLVNGKLNRIRNERVGKSVPEEIRVGWTTVPQRGKLWRCGQWTGKTPLGGDSVDKTEARQWHNIDERTESLEDNVLSVLYINMLCCCYKTRH